MRRATDLRICDFLPEQPLITVEYEIREEVAARRRPCRCAAERLGHKDVRSRIIQDYAHK